jgi:ribosome-associated translation inhibitor RaiA
MTIQLNTDKTVSGDERQREYFAALITEELDRFQSHITRIEVHLSDENGTKEGPNDIRCLLEARLEGRQPIAATNQADTVEHAVSGAIKKLKASLDTIYKRSNRH